MTSILWTIHIWKMGYFFLFVYKMFDIIYFMYSRRNKLFDMNQSRNIFFIFFQQPPCCGGRYFYTLSESCPYIYFILLQFYNTVSTPLSFLSHTSFTATKVCISVNLLPSVRKITILKTLKVIFQKVFIQNTVDKEEKYMDLYYHYKKIVHSSAVNEHWW